MQFVRLDPNRLVVQVTDINVAGTKLITSVYHLDGQLNVVRKFDFDRDYRLLVADEDLNFYGCRHAYDESNPEIHGVSDVYLAKYNNAGQLQWDEYYGGSSWDFPTAMSLASDGSIYFLANTESSDHDVAANAGGQDIWLVKLGESTTSVQPASMPLPFTLFPNPTASSLHLGTLESGMRISVFDLYGRELLLRELQPGEAQLDLSGLQPGLYSLRGVNTAGQTYLGKFVKE